MSTLLTTVIAVPTDQALPPPPSIIPDFQDPYTLRPYNNVAASLSVLFAGLFLLFRLYTKIWISKSCILEDYLCTIGFAGFVVYVALESYIISSKGGTHQWNITERDLATQLRFTNYLDIVYSPACLCIKLSIILLIQRVFCPRPRDPFYWVLHSLNACNTIYYIIYTIIPIVACQPREKIWHPKTSGKCLKIVALYMSSGAFNTVSDLAMFFVPLWRIWHLQMSPPRKLGVSAIFFTGGLAVGASIFRLVYATFLLNHADYSYVKVQSTLASYAELSFGLICSCLFVLPRLYKHLAAIPPYDSMHYTSSRKSKSKSKSGGEEGTFYTEDKATNKPGRDGYHHQRNRWGSDESKGALKEHSRDKNGYQRDRWGSDSTPLSPLSSHFSPGTSPKDDKAKPLPPDKSHRPRRTKDESVLHLSDLSQLGAGAHDQSWGENVAWAAGRGVRDEEGRGRV